jgi:benzoate/toluate 1,2-dioxygenase beta subunit
MLLDLDFDVSTDGLSPADVPADAYHRIAQFLYREARLLDERRYADWQALWTADGMYWMPRAPGQQSPYDHISLFWEDRMLRDVRIRRLEHPRQLAGRYTHKLAAEGEGWRIRMKRVDLVNCDDVHDVFEGFV